MTERTGPVYRILSPRQRTTSGWLTQRLNPTTRIAYDPNHVAGVIYPINPEWCDSPHVVAIEDAKPAGTIGLLVRQAS